MQVREFPGVQSVFASRALVASLSLSFLKLKCLSRKEPKRSTGSLIRCSEESVSRPSSAPTLLGTERRAGREKGKRKKQSGKSDARLRSPVTHSLDNARNCVVTRHSPKFQSKRISPFCARAAPRALARSSRLRLPSPLGKLDAPIRTIEFPDRRRSDRARFSLPTPRRVRFLVSFPRPSSSGRVESRALCVTTCLARRGKEEGAS